MLFQVRPWRLVTALPWVLAVLVAGFFVTRLVGFLHIFGVLQPHSGIRITQGEIELAHNRGRDPSDRPVVPRITHQIFHAWKHPGNDTLPGHWAHARESCRLHNPDWEHKVRCDNKKKRINCGNLVAPFDVFVCNVCEWGGC